jgi:CubicO group peptidase (beta-lactamase class C family)
MPINRSVFRRQLTVLAGFCFLASLAVPSAPLQAFGSLFAPEVSKYLDAQLQRLLKQNNLPSLEVDIQVPGKGDYSFVGGLAELKVHTLRTRNQPFRIASITKPFAATAILAMRLSSRIRWAIEPGRPSQ